MIPHELTIVLVTALGMMMLFAVYLRHLYLLNKIEKLEAEVEHLKASAKKHLPYNTAEELENVLAGIVVLKHELDIKQTLVESIEAHAKLARDNRRAGAVNR